MGNLKPVDLFDLNADALRCPHLVLDTLREESPAQWSNEVGAYVVTAFAGVMEVLRQPQLFSTRYAGGRGSRSSMVPVLLTADPPQHTRQRALVSRAFTPVQVKKLESYIVELAENLIDNFIDDGSVEAINQFAMPLPMTVIARFLGVPQADLQAFKRWSTDVVVFVGNRNPTPDQIADFARSSGEFNEYFRSVITQRRGTEGDDLVSKVVNAEVDGEGLSEDEILTMLRQLLAAGNDTTTNLIGSSLLLLAQDPNLYERVRKEEGFVKPFIEEVLRLESPIQGLYRTAMEDTTICGLPIPEDSQILLMYGAANRDPSEFSDPGIFRSNRDSQQGHVAFGHGVHHCVGAPLARAEARIAIECFTRRIGTLALAPHADIVYEPSFLLRGLERLDLDFKPVD